MRSLKRVEKEVWSRYQDGQNYEQISRMTRIPIRAVQNIVEEYIVLGPPEERERVEKSKKMTSPAAG